MNLLFTPWFAQIYCGNRSPTNQNDFSTSSLSVNISRITTRDSDSDADNCDELEGVFSKMNPISKLVRKTVKKCSLERKPLLSRRMQTLAGEESGSLSDRRNRSSSDEEDLKYFSENYGSVKNAQFANIIGDAIHAISEGVYPERIRQGSSGSYFVKNCKGETIGVFKPKNEEPYGQLNPRWMKWIHRIFFPCCFGRSCLLPNQRLMLNEQNLTPHCRSFASGLRSPVFWSIPGFSLINLNLNLKSFSLPCIQYLKSLF